jgi:hypothetical protein
MLPRACLSGKPLCGSHSPNLGLSYLIRNQLGEQTGDGWPQSRVRRSLSLRPPSSLQEGRSCLLYQASVRAPPADARPTCAGRGESSQMRGHGGGMCVSPLPPPSLPPPPGSPLSFPPQPVLPQPSPSLAACLRRLESPPGLSADVSVSGVLGTGLQGQMARAASQQLLTNTSSDTG